VTFHDKWRAIFHEICRDRFVMAHFWLRIDRGRALQCAKYRGKNDAKQFGNFTFTQMSFAPLITAHNPRFERLLTRDASRLVLFRFLPAHLRQLIDIRVCLPD
jgi:hypothetical protein